MKIIGGFMETESLLLKNGFKKINKKINLANGRSSLYYILKVTGVKKIYIPNFLCSVLLEPIIRLGIPYEFYEIDRNFEIQKFPKLSKSEKILYINYFGLKLDYSIKLSAKFSSSLVIDNTHDVFFNPDVLDSWAFNSYRKSIGVPDGSDLYSPIEIEELKLVANTNCSNKHLQLRKDNVFPEAYDTYKEYESGIRFGAIETSSYSKDIYSRFDFINARLIRLSNFHFLKNELNTKNLFSKRLLDLKSTSTPFSFPYISKKKIYHRHFWNEKVYVPILWKEGRNYNHQDFKSIIHLPIDHRYNEFDMLSVIKVLKKIEERV